MHIFIDVRGVPVHQNLLHFTRGEALNCGRGDIQYAYCPSCGFVSNVAFDESRLEYSPRYENTQGHSPAFRAYMVSIADMLIARYGLRDKRVIEIGCGKGEFLRLLCERGCNRGVGFDPAYIDEPNAPAGVSFVKDFYTERYAGKYPADLIYSRHTIEHVPHAAEFVARVRRAMANKAAVFFETPTVLWILKNVVFWDITYEHCSFFTPGSIARLFAAQGFDVTRVTDAFEGQYLWLEATAGAGSIPDGCSLDTVEDVARSAAHFSQHYAQKQDKLRSLIAGGGRCVIWGAGGKGVSLANLLNIPIEAISYVVDINPRKQGKFIAGTGQEIVAPDFLKTYMPDSILVMNPNYAAEIQQTCDEFGLSATITSV